MTRQSCNNRKTILQLGWWSLDCKVEEMGFELRAPLASFSLADLLEIAGQLGA